MFFGYYSLEFRIEGNPAVKRAIATGSGNGPAVKFLLFILSILFILSKYLLH